MKICPTVQMPSKENMIIPNARGTELPINDNLSNW